MIYTVTFNPALDYIVTMDELNIGYVNRTNTEQILPGGKGINVSIVLNNLGIENTALGFVAGFTGREIEDRVRACGCITDFVHISEGMSRINIKIKAGKETEINGSGPLITREKLDKLYANISCRAAIKANDKNSQPELETIVNILLNDPSIKYCPHGRPVSTTISKNKIQYFRKKYH